MRRLAHDDRGAVVVEFAIIAPVFILILVGILFYGLYFSVANAVQQIAAEAARAAVAAGLNLADRQAFAAASVAADAAANPLIDPDLIAMDPVPAGAEIRVTVRYDSSGLGVWGLAGLLPVPSQEVVRVAVIEAGGLP